MVFSVKSVYSLTGDSTRTLNMLTGKPATNSDLGSLSIENLLVAGDPTPNPTNQAIFMNQPLSWWVESLNSGTVVYSPVSNLVNWSYINNNKKMIYISIDISNLLIPNRTERVEKNPGSMSSTIIFEAKLGLSRVDTLLM